MGGAHPTRAWTNNMGGGLRWEPIRGRPNVEDRRGEKVLSHIEAHRGINRITRRTKMSKTLLQKAKEARKPKPNRKVYSAQEIELALAWAEGEISLTQLLVALDTKATVKAYSFLCFAFRQLMSNGKRK